MAKINCSIKIVYIEFESNLQSKYYNTNKITMKNLYVLK